MLRREKGERWNLSCDLRTNERPNKNCTRLHKTTDPHTHRHGDSMTELAQWGQVSENTQILNQNTQICKLCSNFFF